ncbi:GFA family protein [Caulobacter sp. X]|uniref:GFA family protein n=1 Tax=Caulobacter sp. X TaxID=2048901 RepID=UPI000C149CDD|nr:GFA family protein [Caulobacter sp. X]PIC01472.1 aldehyde-activating protein [Caulobacter sp. X]
MSALDQKVFAPLSGGCHCGAVRYVISAAPRRHSLCCCVDCRRCAGAPMVGWASVGEDTLTITGQTARYNSSGDVERVFCPRCGTGLFYRSASLFPGEVDVSTGTLDDPDALPPTEVIQVADAPAWWTAIGSLPRHARFPEESDPNP